jgi:tetratricopeptide (TPR) repeat protein
LRSLLKALGLTIWGLIAFGLLAIFIFVGYQAALKFRSSSNPVADTHTTKGDPASRNFDVDAVEQMLAAPTQSVTASKQKSPDATRTRFREAAEQLQFGAVAEYGKQLFDSGSASPGDLVVIAHAFYSINDCTNALTWVDRAHGAFQSAGIEPDEALDRMKERCRSDKHPKNTPEFDAGATKSQSGDHDVRLGELYYGFGDYQHAILAIERGLEKGRVTHLDDAYVYLGLSELAVKNFAEACKAFYELEDVPNISPRVLRLWKLFADTHC